MSNNQICLYCGKPNAKRQIASVEGVTFEWYSCYEPSPARRLCYPRSRHLIHTRIALAVADIRRDSSLHFHPEQTP